MQPQEVFDELAIAKASPRLAEMPPNVIRKKTTEAVSRQLGCTVNANFSEYQVCQRRQEFT